MTSTLGCATTKYSTRLDTHVIGGEYNALSTPEGKHRQRSRTGTCQDGATGKPGFPARVDGRAMERRAASRRGVEN